MLLYFVVLLEEAIYIWQKVSQLFCNLIVLRQELMGSPKRAFSIQLYWLTYGKKKKILAYCSSHHLLYVITKL